MLIRELLYIESFENDFKGNHYIISKFLDPSTLTILIGTNLDAKDLKSNTLYKCEIKVKSQKIVVVGVK